MTDSSLEQQRDRGTRAKAILDDDLVVDAFAAIENECIRQFKSATGDELERVWLMMKMSEKFKNFFSVIIENGKVAEFKIARLDEERKGKRRVT